MAARESMEERPNFVAKINELTFGSTTRQRGGKLAKGKNPSSLVQPYYGAIVRLNETAEQKKFTALVHITC
jgi:hypothetical protein